MQEHFPFQDLRGLLQCEQAARDKVSLGRNERVEARCGGQDGAIRSHGHVQQEGRRYEYEYDDFPQEKIKQIQITTFCP